MPEKCLGRFLLIRAEGAPAFKPEANHIENFVRTMLKDRAPVDTSGIWVDAAVAAAAPAAAVAAMKGGLLLAAGGPLAVALGPLGAAGIVLTLLKNRFEPSHVDRLMPELVAWMNDLFEAEPRLFDPEMSVIAVGDPALSQIQVLGDDRFRVSVLYVQHPQDPKSYIPASRFHSVLLNDKRTEFVRLMAHLGAKEIRLAERDSIRTSVKAAAQAKVPVKRVPLGGDAGINTREATSSSFSVEATLGRPSAPPRMPSAARWLPQEEQWKFIAEARLGGMDLQRFLVHFSYTSDFGVDAKLAAKVGAFGLSLGGSFEEMQTLDVDYAVEFWPLL